MAERGLGWRRACALWIALLAALPLVSLAVPPVKAGVSPVGDWTVCGPETYRDTIFEVDGELLVGSSASCGGGPAGQLTIRDGGIRMVQDGSNLHTVTVETGAALTLDASFLTTTTNQVDPAVTLDVTVAGTMITTRGAWLKFPGTFTQTAALSLVRFEDTLITGFEDSELPAVWPAGSNASDANNDGPALTFNAGTTYFARSRVERMWENDHNQPYTGAEQLVVGGSAQVFFFDSFVAADFEIRGQEQHDYINITGATADLFGYNLTIEDSPARFSSPIEVPAGGQGHIVRFLDALVLDENGVPVDQAEIDMEWARTGVAVTYPENAGPSPNAQILTYLGKNAATFDNTGPDGRARIPLPTDNLYASTMPNGLSFGDFNITACSSSPCTSAPFTQQLNLSFPAYPDLTDASNTQTLTFRFSGLQLPQPDLTVSQIALDPVQPLEGTNVTATITVANVRSGGATGVIVRTFDNAILVDERNVGFIAGLTSTQFSITLANVTGGTHNILVIVDPFGAVREFSEGNNQLAAALVVTPLGPDLYVGVSATPNPAYLGSPTTITAVVTNIGDLASSTTVLIAFYRDGSLIHSDTIPVVGVGNSTSVSFSWLPPSMGPFNISARVDSSFLISEPPPYSEANNLGWTTVSTVFAPNLRVDVADLGLSDPIPTVGANVALQVTVRNVGQVASGPATLRFTRDGAPENVFLPPLAPGASTVPALQGSPAPFGSCGLRTIEAWADAFDVVAEGSFQEGDNTATRSVLVYSSGADNITTYSGALVDGLIDADVQTTKSWEITNGASVTIRGATVTFVQG